MLVIVPGSGIQVSGWLLEFILFYFFCHMDCVGFSTLKINGWACDSFRACTGKLKCSTGNSLLHKHPATCSLHKSGKRSHHGPDRMHFKVAMGIVFHISKWHPGRCSVVKICRIMVSFLKHGDLD